MSPFTEPTGSRQALINLLSLLFPFGKHHLPPAARFVLASHSAPSTEAFKRGLQPSRSLSAPLAWHRGTGRTSTGTAPQTRALQPCKHQLTCRGACLGRAGGSSEIAQVFVSFETPWLSCVYLSLFQKMCEISSHHPFLQPDSIMCTTHTYPYNILAWSWQFLLVFYFSHIWRTPPS